MVSPRILSSSMVKVGHGTLSRYREDADAIREPISLGEATGRLSDNYLMLEVDAVGVPEAKRRRTNRGGRK